MPLLVAAGDEDVTRDVFHLLREKRGPVDLDETQDAVREMQLVGTLLEKDVLVRTLGIRLERSPRFVERRRQFLRDDVQGLRANVGHTGFFDAGFSTTGPLKRRRRSPCAVFRNCSGTLDRAATVSRALREAPLEAP